MPFSPSHIARPFPPRLSVPRHHTPYEGPLDQTSPKPPIKTKSHFTKPIKLLLTLNILSTLITWTTQFLLPCTHARLHILTTLCTLLFLHNTLSLLLSSTILFPLHRSTPLNPTRLYILNHQLLLTTSTTCISFLLLAFGSLEGYQHNTSLTIPYLGIALISLLLLLTACLFLTTWITTLRQQARDQKQREKENELTSPVLGDGESGKMAAWRRVLMAGLLLLQTGLVITLVVVGGVQAARMPTHVMCVEGSVEGYGVVGMDGGGGDGMGGVSTMTETADRSVFNTRSVTSEMPVGTSMGMSMEGGDTLTFYSTTTSYML